MRYALQSRKVILVLVVILLLDFLCWILWGQDDLLDSSLLAFVEEAAENYAQNGWRPKNLYLCLSLEDELEGETLGILTERLKLLDVETVALTGDGALPTKGRPILFMCAYEEWSWPMVAEVRLAYAAGVNTNSYFGLDISYSEMKVYIFGLWLTFWRTDLQRSTP